MIQNNNVINMDRKMNKVNKTVGIKKTINKRISILSFIVCFSFLIIILLNAGKVTSIGYT